MQKFFVKPAHGALLVPDPVSGAALPPGGAWKPRSQYWLRRMAQNEIVETAVPTGTAIDRLPPSTKAKG